MTFKPETDRTRLKREPERGSYDVTVIHDIIDSALICHIGLTDHDNTPLVVPTIHARVDDVLYIHGSVASRTLRRLAERIDVCCTFTHVDGVVVARSGFWSSMNYRSVMLFGQSRLVDDQAERAIALDAIVNRIIPGRTAEVRQSTDRELRATHVIALPIEEASAKVRTGDPNDDPQDLHTDVWAGVVPINTSYGEPIAAANLADSIAVPRSVQQMTLNR